MSIKYILLDMEKKLLPKKALPARLLSLAKNSAF